MIAIATLPAPSRASQIASCFKALSVLLGGDAEPLDEAAVLGRRVGSYRRSRGAPTPLSAIVGRVFRTVRGPLRSDAEAEDVTQDAMLTVLTSFHRYSPRSGTRFIAWVTTIAVNTMRRRFRRRRRAHGHGRVADFPGDDADAGAPRPHETTRRVAPRAGRAHGRPNERSSACAMAPSSTPRRSRPCF